MPDTPEKSRESLQESKSYPKDEADKPSLHRNVLLDPIAPGGRLDLPGNTPRVDEERESKASPKLETKPHGISDFQLVKGKSNVANGLKPTPDGYEWLVKNGYKTFVFAHDPAAEIAPVKAICEAAGLKFVGIPTSAETMAVATTSFDAVVIAAKDGPVFVCDDTGLRAGTLWYAHFRRVDLLNPEVAKVRAGNLGLGDIEGNPDQKKLWDALQSLLGK